jgi:putative transposase
VSLSGRLLATLWADLGNYWPQANTVGDERPFYSIGARKPFGFSRGMNGPSPCRLCSQWTEERPLEEQTGRKTFKYKLNPTPQQERVMACVLRRCQELYNAAREERRDAWQKCSVSITLAGQSAQLPDIKEGRPDYRDIHSPVLQDVRARLDRAFQAFFRRLREGQTPGWTALP